LEVVAVLENEKRKGNCSKRPALSNAALLNTVVLPAIRTLRRATALSLATISKLTAENRSLRNALGEAEGRGGELRGEVKLLKREVEVKVGDVKRGEEGRRVVEGRVGYLERVVEALEQNNNTRDSKNKDKDKDKNIDNKNSRTEEGGEASFEASFKEVADLAKAREGEINRLNGMLDNSLKTITRIKVAMEKEKGARERVEGEKLELERLSGSGGVDFRFSKILRFAGDGDGDGDGDGNSGRTRTPMEVAVKQHWSGKFEEEREARMAKEREIAFLEGELEKVKSKGGGLGGGISNETTFKTPFKTPGKHIMRKGSFDVEKTPSKDYKKMYEGLIKTFAKLVSQYRGIVYQITGWKIELDAQLSQGMNKGMVKVRSLYAEREDDLLLFSVESDTDALNFCETEFSKRLDEESLQYLSVGKSIPGFVSNITLRLFEKQTFM